MDGIWEDRNLVVRVSCGMRRELYAFARGLCLVYTAEISGKLRRSYCVPFKLIVVKFPPLIENLLEFLNIDIASVRIRGEILVCHVELK